MTMSMTIDVRIQDRHADGLIREVEATHDQEEEGVLIREGEILFK
jgi:hypothetical protein